MLVIVTLCNSGGGDRSGMEYDAIPTKKTIHEEIGTILIRAEKKKGTFRFVRQKKKKAQPWTEDTKPSFHSSQIRYLDG